MPLERFPRRATRRSRRARAAAALVAALGVSLPRLGAVTISEIHYDPPGESSGLEFVEIANDGPTVVDLSGWAFTEGIVYEFPQGTLLAAKAYLVLCADPNAFRAAYPGVPVGGVFEGRLDSDGETLVLSTNGGGEAVRVKYSNRGKWPAIPAGTGHTLSLRRPHLDASEPENWAASLFVGGTPGAENFPSGGAQDVEIVRLGDTWSYKKGTAEFSTPASSWRLPGFVPTDWPSGPSGFGYGDNDDATILGDMQNGYMSVAVRKEFDVSKALREGADSFVLSINYDDGFVAYLNGTEFARAGMGNPGDPAPYNAAATSHEAGVEEEFSIPKDLVVEGTNAIAIQGHNTALSSSDFSLAPRILARRIVRPPGEDSFEVAFNEFLGRTAGARWVELHNLTAGDLDLGDCFLTDDPDRLDKFAFPPGTAIPPKGFLVVAESSCGLDFGAPVVRLYLTHRSRERVLAAEIFENALQDGRPETRSGWSDARVPDGRGPFGYARTPTPGAPNRIDVETDVVLNEIFYHPPPGSPTPEFIELHNRGGRPVDVGGWAFAKGVEYAIPEGTVIPPGGYLVVSAAPAQLESVHGISGVLGPWTGVLADAGENVRLVDRAGNVADQVRYYDGGRWSRWADGGGSSLELIDPRQDNSFASAWEASDESGKSEWTPISYTGSYAVEAESELQLLLLDEGVVRVDDVSLKRSGSATEYIQNGGFETDASTWRILGTHVASGRVVGDARSGNACLEIRASGPGDNGVNKIETDTQPAMAASAYAVSLWARWVRGSNRLLIRADSVTGASLSRSFAVPLPAALGTPGSENTARARLRLSDPSGNLGPVIGDVRQDPATPDAGQTVRVEATIADSDGVQSAQIRYRTGGVGNGVFSSVPMFDDGAHGDGDAGDGRYAGTIPTHPRNARVVFFIAAVDSRGAQRSYPPEAPERTLLYSVEAPVPSQVFVARLNLGDEDETELQTRYLHSDDLVDGAFVLNDEEIYYNVGVRYHGSPWNRPPNPRMYRVRFAEDRPFIRGLKAANLSRYGSAQNEGTAYLCVQSASTPSSPAPVGEYLYARAYHNASSLGLMAIVETVDNNYVEKWFPGDGGGYILKMPGRRYFNDAGEFTGVQWSSFAYRGGMASYEYERYRWYFQPGSRQTEDEWGPLVALCSTFDVTRTSVTQFDAEIEKILDVEQFLRVEAARTLHDDWDAVGIGNGQNAYVYYAPGEGRWKLIPWDMDHTFGNVDAKLYPEGSEAQVTRLVQRPQYRRLYLRICAQLLGTVYDPSAIQPYLAQTQSRTGVSGDAILSFITARRERILRMFPSGVALGLSSIGSETIRPGWPGLHTTREEAERARGTAPVELATILVLRNGEALDVPVRFTAVTQWTVESLPFELGENRFEVLGFDERGNLAGSYAFVVWRQDPSMAPRIDSVDPRYGSADGGALVRILGTNFQAGARVYFGAVEAASATLVSSAEIRAVAPPGTGRVAVRVVNRDGQAAEVPDAFEYVESPKFVRGDANLDGKPDLSDAVTILAYSYLGGALGCLEAADVDDDSSIQITDPIALLGYLFQGERAPAPPFPGPGTDPDGEADGLGCAEGL